MITGEIFFQIRAQDNNALVKKSKFVWRKKNPPRVHIFRYFRFESRNKNSEKDKIWNPNDKRDCSYRSQALNVPTAL